MSTSRPWPKLIVVLLLLLTAVPTGEARGGYFAYRVRYQAHRLTWATYRVQYGARAAIRRHRARARHRRHALARAAAHRARALRHHHHVP